ncbi:MAG: hypothetical protein IKK41_06795 [Oscillospiraceae bacterium]|nr:hypothetical protein [Oscillospiraceae bacterium]
MKRCLKIIISILSAALLLSGCTMRTVGQMYQLPRRSDDYNNLQSAIDSAMTGLDYSAPLAGENRQTVHIADLDGDEDPEYLVFAKGSAERPLRILIFNEVEDTFVHVDTIESNGSAFDQVEYVEMDGNHGVEIVVGSQLSDQVLRSVSVYTYTGGQIQQMMTANYTKFLAEDLNKDGLYELFLLRPGQTDTDNGIAELYRVNQGVMERSNEVNMSAPPDKLKRILIGKLHDDKTAVYVASTAGETALITDVYTIVDDRLANVSFSNESGTSVKTMRNYYVYADDIDNDGVVELPYLISMQPLEGEPGSDRQELIRWYAMQSDGEEIDKLYTYHNFVGGWYLELDSSSAPRIAVKQIGNTYEFYLWDEQFRYAQPVMSIYALSGQSREAHSREDGRFVLYKTESITYAASLKIAAAACGVTQESLLRAFHLIQQDWKTGET